MVAHVLPFFPEFAFAAEAVASGRYGRLCALPFQRVIAKPDWSSGIADVAAAAGRRSTCTSTTPISSAWYVEFPAQCTREESSTKVRSHT